MKVLIIGGTGTISTAVTRLLAERGADLTLLNRGNRTDDIPAGVKVIVCDANDEQAVAEKMAGETYDVVCQFVAYKPEQVQRDYRLFAGRTKQYIFISSAAAYHRPITDYRITEGTSLANPFWAYARDKAACEAYLMQMFRENNFPVTIVRPSHTYGDKYVPVGAHGRKGNWQILRRMLDGKPVIIHGDGTSLWTITHNSDFAKGFVGLMLNPHAMGEAFHITSDESVTWNQLYATMANCLGVELKAVHVASEFLAEADPPYDMGGSLIGDKANTVVFDNSKVKRAVPDFVCTVRADQGLRKTVRHMLATPELQVEDPEFDAWCDKVIAAMEKAKEDILNG